MKYIINIMLFIINMLHITEYNKISSLLKTNAKIYSNNENPDILKFTDPIPQIEKEQEIVKNILKTKKYTALKKDFLKITNHNINKEKINKWINHQPIPIFRDAAIFFAKNIQYISSEQVITNLEKIGDYLANDNYENSIFILSGNFNKKSSNYFFSILVMSYIYHKYQIYPKTYVGNLIDGLILFGIKQTYIDIDDACYTGTQTTDILERYYNHINIEEEKNSKKKFYTAYKDFFLKTNLKYYVCRLFSTSDLIFPVICSKFIYGSEIQTFEKLENNLSNKFIIEFFLNMGIISKTMCYFDYKIADIVSTHAFVFTNGYIPSTKNIMHIIDFLRTKDIADYLYDAMRTKMYITQEQLNDIVNIIEEQIHNTKDKCIKFINFVNKCKPIPKFVKFIKNNENVIFDYYRKSEVLYNLGTENSSNNVSKKSLSEFKNSDMNNCPIPIYRKYFNIQQRKKSKH